MDGENFEIYWYEMCNIINLSTMDGIFLKFTDMKCVISSIYPSWLEKILKYTWWCWTLLFISHDRNLLEGAMNGLTVNLQPLEVRARSESTWHTWCTVYLRCALGVFPHFALFYQNIAKEYALETHRGAHALGNLRFVLQRSRRKCHTLQTGVAPYQSFPDMKCQEMYLNCPPWLKKILKFTGMK